MNPSTPLVERCVLAQMQAQTCFTSLDISNTLKQERYAVRHRDVAQIVRDIYRCGAMDGYGYRVCPIDVVTDGGTKHAQALLYLPQNARPMDYACRDQSALPEVPPGEAREGSDIGPAMPPLRSWTPPVTGRGARPRHRTRRDGALPISRAWVARMGWQAGDTLALAQDADTLLLGPVTALTGCPVRVWSGLRVRVCRRKLASKALDISAGLVLEARGAVLRIAPPRQ